jgi:hypothetical protein
VKVNTRSTAAPSASVTRIVNATVPVSVGVPVSSPVDGSSVIPAGTAPVATDQVNGAVPPLGTSGRRYATPTSAPGGAGTARLGGEFTATADDGSDGAPEPAAFCARTVNV